MAAIAKTFEKEKNTVTPDRENYIKAVVIVTLLRKNKMNLFLAFQFDKICLFSIPKLFLNYHSSNNYYSRHLVTRHIWYSSGKYVSKSRMVL